MSKLLLRGDKFPVFCEDTKEICYTYSDYLKSNHWYNFKIRYYASELFRSKIHFGGINGKCVCCQVPDQSLDIHHMTYKRLGKEKLWDVIPLCRNCHSQVHLLIKKYLKDGNGSIATIMKSGSWRNIQRKNRIKKPSFIRNSFQPLPKPKNWTCFIPQTKLREEFMKFDEAFILTSK